ncbi:hypothetical protein ACTXJX_14885 [Glutamicibacter ardleyensis]|uniref:hypothetical protein n=1 Tax=Glutamicibacter ardleyensis TaxID=225894 RepID=UPI003FD1BB14
MSKQYRSRVPRGQSAGGQFARERLTESKVSLVGASSMNQRDNSGAPEWNFNPDQFGEEQMHTVMGDPESSLSDRLSAVQSMNSGAPDLALADRDPLIRAQVIGLVGSTADHEKQALADPETRRIYEFLTQQRQR